MRNPLFGAEHCECGDVGYWVRGGGYDGQMSESEVALEQCEFCYTHPHSMFLAKIRLVEYKALKEKE